MENVGDVSIDGNSYRIQLSSYMEKDLADFAPRASVPGGSAMMSELLLYQTLNMTDWRHGLGFEWHTDAMGFMNSDGFIDTRHAGMVHLFQYPQRITETVNDLKTGMVMFNGDLYSWSGAYLRKYKLSTKEWSTIHTGKVNFAMATDKYLFYCPDAAQLRKINTTGTDEVAGTAEAKDYKWLIIHNGYIYGSQDGSNKVHYSGVEDLTTGVDAIEGDADDDPNEIIVGAGGYPTLGAISYGNELYVFRKDGIWNIISDNKTSKRIIDFTSELSDYNFSGYAVYNGYLYITVRNKVYQWNGVRMQDVTPPKISNSYPFNEFLLFGQMVVIKNYLYVPALQHDPEGTDATSFRIVLLCYDGVGWHKLCTVLSQYPGILPLASYNIHAFTCYDALHTNLYISAWPETSPAATTSTILEITMPDGEISKGPFYTTDTDFSESENYLLTSKLDMGYRRVKKSLPSILIEGNNLSETVYLNVSGTFDGSTEAIDFGKVTRTGITELYPPSTSMAPFIPRDDLPSKATPDVFTYPVSYDFETTRIGSTIEFYNAVFKVEFINASTDTLKTPILEGITARFLMRPDVFYGYSFTIVASQSYVYGAEQDDRSPQEILTSLREARDSKSPISFVDLYGSDHVCYISSVSVQAVERHENSIDGTKNVEAYIKVNLVEAK